MGNCDACKEIKTAEPVPFIVHESAQARNERAVKRLVIALIVAIALTFASNAIWLYAWMQYDYSSEQTESVTVDGKDGVANYIGNDGDIVNGADYGN
jgi:hypothetical protein